MMIEIIRQASTPLGTAGLLFLPELHWGCDTLELPWADNQRGISCVLADRYSAKVWASPSLKRNVIRLEDKHGRADVLIHNGNWASTAPGAVTQVHGCIEVGHGYGQISRPDGKSQWGIRNSGPALEELIAELGAGPHEVLIQWALGAEPEGGASCR